MYQIQFGSWSWLSVQKHRNNVIKLLVLYWFIRLYKIDFFCFREMLMQAIIVIYMYQIRSAPSTISTSGLEKLWELALEARKVWLVVSFGFFVFWKVYLMKIFFINLQMFWFTFSLMSKFSACTSEWDEC